MLLEQGHEPRPRRRRPLHRDAEGRPTPDRSAHDRGRARPQDRSGRRPRAEALRRRRARQHGDVRDRSGRHRQELPRGGAGGAGAPGEAGQPHHPHPPAVEAASGSASCPATSSPRSTRTSVRSTTRSTTCSSPRVVARLMDRGTIEVAPLAFMRGRTLNDSFIILDEAQNTTPEQMKMFLTRLGFGSKDRRHRRRHPDRPARGARSVRSPRGARRPRRHRRPGVRRARLAPTSCATGSSRTSSTPTKHELDEPPTGTVSSAPTSSATSRSTSSAGCGSPASCSTQERVPDGPTSEMSVIFVDEPTIADLNERFLGARGPTDVLAFPMDDDVAPGGRQPDQGGRGPGRRPRPPTRPPCSATSWCARGGQRARRTGEDSLDDEVALLVVHGVLHLLTTTMPRTRSPRRCRASASCSRFHELEGRGTVTAGSRYRRDMTGAAGSSSRSSSCCSSSIWLAVAETAFLRMSRVRRRWRSRSRGRRSAGRLARCSSTPSGP